MCTCTRLIVGKHSLKELKRNECQSQTDDAEDTTKVGDEW